MKTIESMDNRGRFELGNVSKGLIGIGVSAAFIALTLRGIDLTQVKNHLREIDVGMLPHIIISLTIIFLYKAFRWQYQMSPMKRIAFGQSLSAIIIGYMANNVVPLRGGDLLRAHLLGRQENIGTTAVFATVALERIFDVLSLVTLSLIILLMVPLPNWLRHSVIILGAILLGCIIFIIMFRSRTKLFEKWWEIVRCRLPGKMQEILSTSIKQVHLGLETARGRARLTNLYILAVAEWALWGLLANYSLQALGIQLSIAATMTTVIATNLALLIPAAPGNIGVFDYAVMTTLEFFQFDKSIALSGAVIVHAIFVIPVSLVGLLFFIREWLVPKGGISK